MSGPLTFKPRPESLYFLRNRKDEIFPGGSPSGSVLVSNIAFGAAALGVGHVEIKDHEDWWFVASETNWLALATKSSTPISSLFERLLPFPELGPSSHHPEVFVATFGDRIYLDLDGEHLHIQGKALALPLPHIGVIPPWCKYVLGFTIDSSI